MNNNPRRNTEPEMIEVLQASICGKQIERRMITGIANEWQTCKHPIDWRFAGYQYRVAPGKPVGVNTLAEISIIVDAAVDFLDIEFTSIENPVGEGYLPFNYNCDTFHFEDFHYRIRIKQ